MSDCKTYLQRNKVSLNNCFKLCLIYTRRVFPFTRLHLNKLEFSTLHINIKQFLATLCQSATPPPQHSLSLFLSLSLSEYILCYVTSYLSGHTQSFFLFVMYFLYLLGVFASVFCIFIKSLIFDITCLKFKVLILKTQHYFNKQKGF